ncbi:hypothetical protein [Umezawaea sp. Da 62-37]|uniref:hypothetical protein n=1 Tax=Umezawaea sp. Da 62-37 TaxID=3075927 RepID=UPI0028F71730|nr:hypothetical protein [Umezawaea sp. Da 62-37]WNV88550.1 hypothetical protein RM788_09695 [Umezawaea sp. Da 62-37]
MPAPWAPPPAPKPGVIPLRVLNVGEIFSGAFRTVRRHLGLLVVPSALLLLLSQGVSLLVVLTISADYQRMLVDMRPGRGVPAEFWGLFWQQMAASSVSLGVSALVQTFLTGLVTVVVSRAVLGKPITAAEAWAELRPRAWHLVAVSILYLISVVIATLFCLLPGVWVAVVFSLAVPALVLEKLPVRRSFTHSRALVRNAWWSTFGILTAAYATVMMITFLAGLPFTASVFIDGTFTQGVAALSTPMIFLSSLVGVVVSAFTAPFYSAVVALVYLDRRIQVERLDLVLARAAAA